MDLRQLTCFDRVADLGSMSRAAEAIHLVQPAVSQQIALLERPVRPRPLHPGPRGPAALGITPSAVIWLLPELLELYRGQHPLVQIQVHEDMTDRLMEHLADGRLDLSVVSLPIDDDGLAVRPVLEERLAL